MNATVDLLQAIHQVSESQQDLQNRLFEDQLSWALCRILELEESLDEANDTINRWVAGNVMEWDV